MPLRKQKVSVIISQGVQTKVDQKVLPPESLTLLENGAFSKVGKIEKRRGFTKISEASSGLISYGESLLSRNTSIGPSDDTDQASTYSESLSGFVGESGWSSGINYSSSAVSEGASLWQQDSHVSVSIDGKYALITFVSFDIYRDGAEALYLDYTVTKKCSLVDRATGSLVFSDMKIGTAANKVGTSDTSAASSRMRSLWVNDKFYIVGEEQGDIRLWSLDPSESNVALRDGDGVLASSSNGTLLYSNVLSATGTQDYPLISDPTGAIGLRGTFDIETSSTENEFHIVRIRTYVSGPDDVYSAQYCIIDVDSAGSSKISSTTKFSYDFPASSASDLTRDVPQREMVLYRTRLSNVGGIGDELFLAYCRPVLSTGGGSVTGGSIELRAFTEGATSSSSRGSLEGSEDENLKMFFLDNSEPTNGSGSYPDVDFYVANLEEGKSRRYPSISANSGSQISRSLGGSGMPLFGYTERLSSLSSEGPATLGVFQAKPTRAYGTDPMLSPIILATSDTSNSVLVEGVSYTGKQYPRERDYITLSSFEESALVESPSVATPNWPVTGVTTQVGVEGTLFALPLVSHFNSQFGAIIPSTRVVLFDVRKEDNEQQCRPSSAVLKDILYVADKGLYSYDSQSFQLHGSLVRPWLNADPYTGIVPGAMPVGAVGAGAVIFFYKGVFEWEDALGNLHQSESSVADSDDAEGTGTIVDGVINVTFPTALFSSSYGASSLYDQPSEVFKDIKFSVYRTRGDGTLYNLNSSLNPFRSNYVDKVVEDRLSNDANAVGRYLYSDSGELQNTAPPSPPVYVASHNGRLFTIGKDKGIHFSKLAVDGYGLAFNLGLKLTIPNALSDPPSALGSMDGVLYVFTKNSIYYLMGEGPDNLGQGDFYDPKRLPSPVGAYAGSPVALIDDGLLFCADEGIFLLGRDQSIFHVGAPVEELLGDNKVLDIKVDAANQLVYFQTSSSEAELLTYNYGLKQWGRDVLQDESSRIESIEIYRNKLAVSTGANLYLADSGYSDGSSYIPLRIKTAWLKLDTLQGYQRAYSFQILGESVDSHKLIVKVRYDYEDDSSPDVYEYTSDSSGKLQMRGHLKRQKCQSLQFEIYDEDSGSSTKGGYSITQIELEFGYKPDQYKNGMMKIPAANTVGSN
jgi:hypothetical protein